MQPLPNTFCPAKWDEISLNFAYDYVYACCKSTPTKYTNGDYREVIVQQKNNLLNDIQDPSCNFCWKIENQNLPSKRHDHLKIFDKTKFNSYKTDEISPTLVELYIGNECNFQCTYCNPKYSSQWEADVKKLPYKIFTDKHFFEIDIKNQNINQKVLETVTSLDNRATLSILGGEPLHNKFFWYILDNTRVQNFALSTNLSAKIKDLQKLYEKCSKFKKTYISISLDSTGNNAEFIRYGMNFNDFENNLNYLLDNITENIHININALMTSVTIHDIDNFFNFLQNKKQRYEKLTCKFSPCVHPRIQSFDTLPDIHKEKILNKIDEMQKYTYLIGLDVIQSSLISSKFNKTLYQELKHFLNQFAARKKIEIPICLN